MQNGSKPLNISSWQRKVEVLELQSGTVVRARRISLASYIKAGRVPQSFFDMSGAKGKALDASAMQEVVTFALGVMGDVLEWPKVVDEPKGEGETRAEDIPFDDLLELLNWSVSGAPVQTTSGEVSASAVAQFRPDADLQGGGLGGADVRTEALATAGDS